MNVRTAAKIALWVMVGATVLAVFTAFGAYLVATF